MMYYSSFNKEKRLNLYITEEIQNKIYNIKCAEFDIDLDYFGNIVDVWKFCRQVSESINLIRRFK